MPLSGSPDVETLTAKRDIAGLVKAAGYDHDYNVRKAATKALGELRDPRAVTSLIGELDVNLHNVTHLDVIEALGRIGDPRAIDALSAKLDRGWQPDVRAAAAESLGKIGPPAVDSLVASFEALLKRSKTSSTAGLEAITRTVAGVLGQTGDARAVPPLVAALEASDVSASVDRPRREVFAKALAKVADQRATEPLFSAAQRYWYSCPELLPALERIAPSDERILPIRLATAKQWGKCVEIGAAAVDPLVTYLAEGLGYKRGSGIPHSSSPHKPQDVEGAMAALCAIGDEAVKPLIHIVESQVIDDPDNRRTVVAVRALGRIGDPRAIETVYAAGSVEALVAIGDPAVERLCDFLKSETSQIRQAAAEGLGRICAVRSIEPLRAVLDDRFESVRRAAAEALLRIDRHVNERVSNSLEPQEVVIPEGSPRAHDHGALLTAFARALAREAHVILDRPEILWQQMFNRLQWLSDNLPHPLAGQLAIRCGTGSLAWMRTRTRADESTALVRTLVGHSGQVLDCAFSPDGRFIVSASSDATLKLWDPLSGQLLRTLAGHEGAVTSCAVSLDGDLVVSVGADLIVKLWDVNAGAEIQVTPTTDSGSEASVESVDGRYRATFGSDGNLTVRDAVTDEVVFAIQRDGATQLVPSPDHAHAISTFADTDRQHVQRSGLAFWDVGGGELVRRLTHFEGRESIYRKHPPKITSAFFGPDGVLAASACADKTVKLWDVRDGTELRLLEGHEGGVNCCSISPDGRFVVSASDDRLIRVWETTTGDVSGTLAGHMGAVTACAVSPDGTLVASGSADGTVKLWDMHPGGEQRRTVGHTHSVRSCLASQDNQFFISVSDDRTLKLWDSESGLMLHTLEAFDLGSYPLEGDFSNQIVAFAVSPNGGIVVSAYDHGEPRLWDTASGTELCKLAAELPPYFDLPGKGSERDGRLSDERKFSTCAFRTDSGTLLSVSGAGTFAVWDVKDGHQRDRIQDHFRDQQSKSHMFSPDQRLLAYVANGVLRCRDVTSGLPLSTHCGDSEVASFLFGPDSVSILIACDDFSLKLWRADVDVEARTLITQDQAITAMTFSPDGRLVVSANPSGTMRLYDVERGQDLGSLPGHQGTVRACKVTPDGCYILSVGIDSTLRLWDAKSRTHLATLPLAAPGECLGLHRSLPTVFCGDQAGNVYLSVLAGIEYGPLIITAHAGGGHLSAECPACHGAILLNRGQLGRQISCPEPGCRVPLRLNKFTVD